MTQIQDASTTQGTTAPAVTEQPIAIVPTPIVEVCTLLKSADKAAGTIFRDIMNAAALASAAMSAGLTPLQKVDQVMAIYAALWLEISDHNVKAWFKNALWIHADPKAQVTIPVTGATGEAAQTQIVDASTVLGMSKLTITDVSKQIRDINDASRAPGGGRKKNDPVIHANPLPNTGTPAGVTPPAVTPPAVTPPAVTPPAVTAPAGTPAVTAPAVTPKPSDAAPTFYEELEKRLDNPGEAAKVHAAIMRRGYRITRAENVTPAAVTPDATAALASALLETTPTTAIMQAAAKATEAAKGKNLKK
jgi:hypothetical protein